MTNAGDNIFFIDNDYAIQKVSRKLSLFLGLDNACELVGKQCYNYFFKTDRPCDNCPVSRSITFQTVVEEEILIDAHDQARGSRTAVATPVMDDQNQVRQVIVDCLGDLFQTKIASQAGSIPRPAPLLPMEDVESNPVDTIAAVLFDNEFNIILCNHWYDAPGFGAGEKIAGRNLFSAAPFYNQSPLRSKLENFVKQSVDQYVFFRTKSDIYSAHWLEHHVYTLLGQSNIDAYLVLTKIDHNQAFLDSRALMAEKAALLSKFASRISHDIKNPLALISTSVEFLKTDLAKVNALEDIHGVIDYIYQVQDQVNRVIDILDTVNALKVHSMDTVSEVDAAELLDRAVTISLLAKPFPQNDITIKAAGSMPAIHVSEINVERAFAELFKSLLQKAGENGVLDINLAYIEDVDNLFVFKIHTNIVQQTVLDLNEMMQDFFASGNRFNIANLGLVIAYATIINHSGEMQVLTLESGELEIIIKLPRMPQDS